MKKFFKKMDEVDRRLTNALHIHRSVHLAKLMVQYAPPVGAGLMMCHIAYLLRGYAWTIASVIARSALLVFALMVVLSVAFGFCWIHRALCLYNFLVNACIEYERWVGFGSVLTSARWLMLGLGVALFALYFRRKWLITHYIL